MNSSFDRASNGKEEWLTPPHIFKALGQFDLDPCAPTNRPWDTALKHYTIDDDGLLHDWRGSVWLNPPYGDDAAIWMRLMARHNQGIALTFARTETTMFFESIWNVASAMLFIKGRLKFWEFNCANCGHAASSHGNKKKMDKDSSICASFHKGTTVREGESAGAPSVLIAYGMDDAQRLANCGIEGKFIRLKGA